MENNLNFIKKVDEFERRLDKKIKAKYIDDRLDCHIGYGLKKLGLGWLAEKTRGELVSYFKKCKLEGYSYDESLILTLDLAVERFDVYDREKMHKAIKDTLAFDPDNKLRFLKFKKKYPSIVFFMPILLGLAFEIVLFVLALIVLGEIPFIAIATVAILFVVGLMITIEKYSR